MTSFSRKILNYSLAFVLFFAGSSCLKTRAQLKEEGGDRDAPLKSQPAEMKAVDPGGSYMIDEIKSEITRLSGRIEELERQHKQETAAGASPTAETTKKLEGRLGDLEKSQLALQEELKKLTLAAPPANPEEMYDKARQQYDGGELAEAIESFTHYLKAPTPKHAEEAYYLRGESFYRLKEYKKAILDFSKFSEKYTGSKHGPAALMKIGLSFDALGMKDDAKGFYQELVEKYPKAPEAKKVRGKLK